MKCTLFINIYIVSVTYKISTIPIVINNCKQKNKYESKDLDKICSDTNRIKSTPTK